MDTGRNIDLLDHDQVLDNASLENRVEELCESGLILKAYEILMRNADIGVTPNIKTYGILIDAFLKKGKINQAFELFKDLHVNELSPDSVTYEILINGLYKAGREEDAVEVFYEMVENEYTPSSYSCKLVMIWLCKKKKFLDAFNLWLSYLKSLSCDGEAMKNIHEHFKNGEIGFGILRLLETDLKLKRFDVDPYTIWLIGFCQAGRVEEALQIYEALVDYKIKVTAPSCVMLIRGLCKKKRLDVALEVFLYALNKGFSLTPPIRIQLLRSIIHSMPRLKYSATSSDSLS